MRDFNHTVNVLVKAYLNDTLSHGVCDRCAVGNIVNASCNNAPMMCHVGWPTVFLSDNHKQRIMPVNYAGEAKRQIDATGYTWQELARIEIAFEEHDITDDWEQNMFNGLMAVVDVLAEIHGIDLTAKEQAKALFVKA